LEPLGKLEGSQKAKNMHIDWSAVAIVFATILGPILAVQAQKYLERHRDQGRVKDAIFRVLMATRASRLTPGHVEALNGIELAYYGGGEKEKKVREAWKAYHNHLNDKSYEPDRMKDWEIRQIDLVIDLLHEMAVCLGYDFDKTHIKNSYYTPVAHGTIEQQFHEIRGAMADILTGKRFLPIGFSQSPEDAKEAAEIRKRLLEWLRLNTQQSGRC
jgi:hypothetical protein